jgi:mRNA-degrading endonuclease RelE of RelBE toxin-antitoxin system
LFEVNVSDRAVRELRDLPQRDAERVLAAVRKLQDWPQVTLDVVKLVGEPPGTYRLRVGRYRCHFRVQTAARRITVSSVRKRQRAYG